MIMKQPDPKLHQAVSFVKSGVRILGYLLLPAAVPTPLMGFVAAVLVISELIGIAEELV